MGSGVTDIVFVIGLEIVVALVTEVGRRAGEQSLVVGSGSSQSELRGCVNSVPGRVRDGLVAQWQKVGVTLMPRPPARVESGHSRCFDFMQSSNSAPDKIRIH